MSKKDRTHLPADLELVRLELYANNCPLPLFSLEEKDILQEIAYVLKPKTHERRIPPYGSITCPGGFQYEGSSKLSSAPPLDPWLIRTLADGRRTLLVKAAGGIPELWRLEHPCETELDLLDLARATKGLVLKRIESGLVSLIFDGWAYTVRGREWLVRRPISEMTDAVRQVAPGLLGGAQPLLELCCYVLSPKNLGATFVLFLREPAEAETAPWARSPDIRLLSLDLGVPESYPQIVHLARHNDGAFLVDPQCRIRSLGAHLTYTSRAEELIGAHGGTRHTSAKRYSFEHAAAVVFVVSEDGHVSVFSDGVRVADSPVLASSEAQMLRASVPAKARDVSYARDVTTCPRCGKDLVIQIVTVIGWKDKEEVSCPVCGQEAVYSDMCWSLTATPIKKL